MEQEQPENAIPVENGLPAESLDTVLRDAAENRGLEPASEARLPNETAAETTFDIAEPHITASQPPVFSEVASPFDELIPGSAEVWPDQMTMDDPFVPVPYAPVAESENIRRSGLAWSAGVAFFGSVAFMLFLGWLADLLLGTSPWGIVGGIVLGSVIGFLQFFRITSQIFARKDDSPGVSPLMSRKDDE